VALSTGVVDIAEVTIDNKYTRQPSRPWTTVIHAVGPGNRKAFRLFARFSISYVYVQSIKQSTYLILMQQYFVFLLGMPYAVT